MLCIVLLQSGTFMKMPNFQETVPVEVAVKPGHTQQQIRSFTDTMCPQSRVIFHIGVVAHTSNGLIVKLVLEVWLFGRICHLISQLVWVHWRFHTLCLKIPMDFKPTTTTPGILWPSEASRVSVIVQGGYCCSLQKFDRNCSFPVSQCTYLCLVVYWLWTCMIVNMYAYIWMEPGGQMEADMSQIES